MDLERRMRAGQRFDPGRFLPFVLDGATLGYVRRDLVRHLDAHRDVLDLDEASIGFRSEIDGQATRSLAMADIARALAGRGLLSPWRDETYDIRAAEGAPTAFVLERAAVRFFGFTARAIHVNGLTRDGDGPQMWIARRSPTKAIDPGMLDNMVGGGLASGSSIERTLVKEAWEEAGIPAELAGRAQPAGTVRICREVPEGLHVEIIYVHDLELPGEFAPRNQDGEVAEFRRARIEDVIAELRGDAPYTVDAGMVALDCLARRGWVGPFGSTP